VRDNLVVGLVCASLPFILFRPFLGLLVYDWLAYMRPQNMAWATSRYTPLSLWVAVAMAVGLVLSVGRERLLTIRPQTILLILLSLWISLTVMTAVVPEMSQVVYGQYWKAIAVSVIATGLVRDRRRLRWVMLMIVVSIGFLGAKRGLIGLVKGGARYDDGPGGFMSDNNSFALALNMILPFLVGLALSEKKRWARLLAAATAGLCVLCILFTFSRGGLLTLAVVGGLLVWRSKRRLLVAGLLALSIGGFALFSTSKMMEDYVKRASSISNYEEDESARGRLNAWETSWRVFLDYPILGVGPNNLEAVFFRYAPDTTRFRVTHDAYLQLLSECGLPSLLLFLGVLGVSLWRMQKLREETTLPPVELQARMIQISIVGYMVGAIFLNMAYCELIYSVIALSVSLEVVAEKEAALVAQAAPAGEPVLPASGLPWWKQPRQDRLAPAGAPRTAEV
jgi:probable O-glycosylation ligase (exosortase A-associated)